MTVTANILNNTLNVVGLAREIALANGNQPRAEKFGMVEAGLRKAAENAQNAGFKQEVGDILAQNDFQTMLSLAQGNSPAKPSNERNQVINAMSAGGMSPVDIARHVGMTTGEVQMIVAMNTHNNNNSVEFYQ